MYTQTFSSLVALLSWFVFDEGSLQDLWSLDFRDGSLSIYKELVQAEVAVFGLSLSLSYSSLSVSYRQNWPLCFSQLHITFEYQPLLSRHSLVTSYEVWGRWHFHKFTVISTNKWG